MTRRPLRHPLPYSAWGGIGHNGGPPLEEEPDAFVAWRWRKAHREVWRNPSMSILRFRVARAESAGVSYREYMLELLDTGRHLQRADVEARGGGNSERPAEPAEPASEASPAEPQDRDAGQ